MGAGSCGVSSRLVTQLPHGRHASIGHQFKNHSIVTFGLLSGRGRGLWARLHRAPPPSSTTGPVLEWALNTYD